MVEDRPDPTPAWQPFTFRGVAAFARAGFLRVLAVAAVIAGLNAAVCVWFLHHAWVPVIETALQSLPAGAAQIRGGQLEWPGAAPVILADSPFATLVVDPHNTARVTGAGDVMVVFGRDTWRVCTLLGCVSFRHPTGWVIALNRPEVEPWWGAWRPFLTGGAGVIVFFGLLGSWLGVAALTAGPARLIALFADRVAGLGGCWKLGIAALQPGAVLLLLAVLAYGLGAFPLVGLAVVAGAQLLWFAIYLVASLAWLPRAPAAVATPENPFAGSAGPAATPAEPPPERPPD